MKKNIVTIAFLFGILSTIWGQTAGTFYYASDGSSCDSTHATKKYIITDFSGILKEEVYTKQDHEWKKGLRSNIYDFENDSVVTIKEFIGQEPVPVVTVTTKQIYHKLNDTIYTFINYDKNLKIQKKGAASSILPLILEGEITSYYDNGNIRCVGIYKNNKPVSNKRWNKNGEPDIDNVFDFNEIDVNPKYTDHLNNFVSNNLKYPLEAQEKRMEGKSIIEFVIMEDGSIKNVGVLKSSKYPILDNEAIRVVQLTNKKWIPGTLNKKPVRVYFVAPCRFKLLN